MTWLIHARSLAAGRCSRRDSAAINGLKGRRSQPRKPHATLVGDSGAGAPYENSFGAWNTIGMGLGSLRVVYTQSALKRVGWIPGALDITCASPCGNITISPVS